MCNVYFNFFVHKNMKKSPLGKKGKLKIFLILAWLPKRPIFGKNKNLTDLTNLFSIHSLTCCNSQLSTFGVPVIGHKIMHSIVLTHKCQLNEFSSLISSSFRMEKTCQRILCSFHSLLTC